MPTDFVEIAMLGVSAADPTQTKNFANVYQFRRSFGGGVPTKSEINTAFQTAIGDKVLLALNEDYTQTFNTIRYFDDALDAPLPFVQTGTGALTGERCPDYVTATVRLKSGVRSRSGRGRKSYGPLDEDSTTGDNLSTAAITLFTTVATAILAGFTDASANVWVPVIKSLKPPGQYTVNPTTMNTFDVLATSVNSNLGILKRRKVKP